MTPIIDTSGFYRLDTEGWHRATTFVTLDSGERITREGAASYTYPIEGWYWCRSEAEAESVVVPYEVTMFQLRAALRRRGRFDVVDSYIASCGNAEIQDAWQYQTVVCRYAWTVLNVIEHIGSTQAEADAAFRLAAKIDVKGVLS